MKFVVTSARPTLFAAAVSLTVALAGCSSINTAMQPDRIDYKSATKESRALELPPDLVRAPGDPRYALPGARSGATLSAYQEGRVQQQVPGGGVLPQVPGMRIERDGRQRWLSISAPPTDLWERLREFWQESGFLLTVDSPETGIMETDWAENRAKLPQDFIRNTIGKVFEGLYSTGERDKFRVRLERNPQGGTDLFISHRGVEEVLVGQQKDRTMWTARPADPELEAEFLARIMQRLGARPEEAQAQKSRALAGGAKPAASAASSRVAVTGEAVRLDLPEAFDRAWRQVGLALDRSNFTVEDRDRSRGLYFVRYVDQKEANAQPGFFERLLGGSGDDAKRAKRYQISVRQAGNGVGVTVLDEAGRAAPADVSRRILTLLDEQLR